MTNLIFEPAHTTHWKNLFPHKMLLLGSQNMNPGEELIAEIKSVDIQEIKNGNGEIERVPVLQFTKAPPMVLNITNARTVACLYGPDYEQWIGQSVQIYVTTVKAFGEITQALRIREAKPEVPADVGEYEKQMSDAKTVAELQDVWMSVPKHLRPQLLGAKDSAKGKL